MRSIHLVPASSSQPSGSGSKEPQASCSSPELPQPAEAKPLDIEDPAVLDAFFKRVGNGGLLSGV